MCTNIRKSQREDEQALVVLYRACFDDGCPEIEITSRAESALLAEVDGELAGFLIHAEPVPYKPHVWSVGVKPEHRKQGIASALLQEFEAAHKGATSLSLHVHPDNAAQKLYFDQGYRVVAILPEYYRAMEDGLVMIKKLI